MTKQYYSARTKFNNLEKVTINHETFIEFVDEVINEYENKGFFVYPSINNKREMTLVSLEKFNKTYLLPYRKNYAYQEDDIFDLIEFFYDCLSVTIKKPTRKSVDKASYIKISSSESPQIEGFLDEIKGKYRESINRIINNYGVGFELTEEGYIRELINNGLEELINSKQSLADDIDSNNRIKYAKEAFFRHGATEEEKRGAIFALGTVLEKLRDSKQLKLNSKDTGDLFTILNGFNIRHNRKDQKSDYDKDIFYPWMFYNLLAAVDASLKLQENSNEI